MNRAYLHQPIERYSIKRAIPVLHIVPGKNKKYMKPKKNNPEQPAAAQFYTESIFRVKKHDFL